MEAQPAETDIKNQKHQGQVSQVLAISISFLSFEPGSRKADAVAGPSKRFKEIERAQVAQVAQVAQ